MKILKSVGEDKAKQLLKEVSNLLYMIAWTITAYIAKNSEACTETKLWVIIVCFAMVTWLAFK